MANRKATMTDLRVIIREFAKGTPLREIERKLGSVSAAHPSAHIENVRSNPINLITSGILYLTLLVSDIRAFMSSSA